MITRKIPMERREMRFLDDRKQNGNRGKGPPSVGLSVHDRATQKAVYHVTNFRPWTSTVSRRGAASQRLARNIDGNNNSKTNRKQRPKTTASVLRQLRGSQPIPTPASNLKSASAHSFGSLHNDTNSLSFDARTRMSRAEVTSSMAEDRRPATTSGSGSHRGGSLSRAQYFDLSSPSSARHANRKEILSANKLQPRHSPMLAPSATSASGPRTSRVAIQPWSVTEVPDEEETNEAHVTSNGDAVEECSSSSSSEEEPEPEVPKRVHHRRISNKPQTLQQWSDGPPVNSDDYDTDLEEDFPPEPETIVDATGGLFYEEQCTKKGIVPVTYLLRNMGEGNLRMRHHYLGGQGTRPLAQALKKNTVCEEIDLSDNYIEGSGAAALADTLKDNMFIVNLNVSNNFIRSEGAEKMAEMLESNTTLKTLSLQGNQLSDEDAKRIAESLKNNMSLSCLDLSHNKFGEVGGLYLSQGIAGNIGLADLDLSWNCIREKGGVAIAKAVAKNTALEILDLSWNGLSYVGTVALANALKSNKTLKVLDISNNRMNPEGAKVLGKALAKNVGLETLLLGLNPIGAEGVEAILKGAAAHPRLKLLGIENTMDLSMVPALNNFVKELQESRDIMIMATTGPPQQSRINATVLAVFDRFLTENADRMEDLFNQMDKDGSGDVTLEELKYGLKDFGLRLTSKQLDTLLDELDADKSGTIEYSELMQGSALIKREKQKMDRAQAEAMMYKDNAANNTTASPTSSSTNKQKTEVAVK